MLILIEIITYKYTKEVEENFSKHVVNLVGNFTSYYSYGMGNSLYNNLNINK
jgi:hypothetical protein